MRSILQSFMYQGSRKVKDLLESGDVFPIKVPDVAIFTQVESTYKEKLENALLPSASLFYQTKPGNFNKSEQLLTTVKLISYWFSVSNITVMQIT